MSNPNTTCLLSVDKNTDTERAAKQKTDELLSIPKEQLVREFNENVNALLSKLEKRLSQDKRGDIFKLRQRIAEWKRQEGIDILTKSSYVSFCRYSKQINERKDSFFLDMDVSREYQEHSGEPIEREDEFLLSLIEIIKTEFKSSSPEYKAEIWKTIHMMQTRSLAYKHKSNLNRLPS